MTHTHRPDQITAILKIVSSEFPAAMGDSLETYISGLEANQQTLPETTRRDPARLYWQGIKRQQNRRARALRKHNNYQ
jgi:hypothetical protein